MFVLNISYSYYLWGRCDHMVIASWASASGNGRRKKKSRGTVLCRRKIGRHIRSMVSVLDQIPYRSSSLHIAWASFREFAIVAVTIEIGKESGRKRMGRIKVTTSSTSKSSFSLRQNIYRQRRFETRIEKQSKIYSQSKENVRKEERKAREREVLCP